jgi:KDO2-lipid IV(A) lauroyltransferase
MRLVSTLPLPLLVVAGKGLGKLLYLFFAERKKITEINLRIAFPDAPEKEIKRLLRASIENIGIAAFEMGLSWWHQDKLFSICKVEGLDNLQAAQQAGQGIIILSAHFTCVEVGGPIINHYAPIYVMYKHAKNRLFDSFTKYHRNKVYQSIVDHRKPIDMIRGLKKGYAAWYLPDQDVSNKDSIFIPFFGVQATALTTTARIAKATKSKVVPFTIKRNNDNRGYTLNFFPALDNFPSDNVEQDTLRINQTLEHLILQNPEQYLWAHKRYKHRPPGSVPIYPTKKL